MDFKRERASQNRPARSSAVRLVAALAEDNRGLVAAELRDYAQQTERGEGGLHILFHAYFLRYDLHRTIVLGRSRPTVRLQ